jgi:hypothetical protein
MESPAPERSGVVRSGGAGEVRSGGKHLLLELDAREALGGYEASLADSPGRFNGIVGAARAAAAGGLRERAAEHYRALLELAGEPAAREAALAEAGHSPPGRAELQPPGAGGARIARHPPTSALSTAESPMVPAIP